MRIPFRLPLAAVLALVVLQGAASAQTPGNAPARPAAPAAPSGTLIAIIDIPFVLEHYERLKQQMEGIKQEVQSFEGDVVAQRKQLTQNAQQLQALNQASPEHKQLEEQLARESTDLQLKMQLKKRDVLEKEAKYYYETYNEVVAVVQQIADRYNIGLVLRFDSKQIDPNDLDSVGRGLSRTVVYQRNLDITQMVVDELNRRAPPATNNAARPAPVGQPPVRLK